MKTLTQAWELIQLLSSLHFLSPALVRASNPQTYASYCSYNLDNERPLHIDICDEESCEYYIRIKKSYQSRKAGNTVNLAIAGTGAVLSPFTVGLSGILLSPLAVFSDHLMNDNMNTNLKAIEDELKLKWENEQAGQNSTSETTSETSNSEVNSETNEEEEVAAEEPRPWWNDTRETAENEVENRTNNETNRSENFSGRVIRPDGTVLTNMPDEEVLLIGQKLDKLVEQSNGKNRYSFKIETPDKDFSYYITAERKDN